MKRVQVVLQIATMVLCAMAGGATAGQAKVLIDLDEGGPIRPLLMGVFFEDLSYAAAAGPRDWHSLSFWHLETRGGGEGDLISDSAAPSIRTIRSMRCSGSRIPARVLA